jgi:hypothetical protein
VVVVGTSEEQYISIDKCISSTEKLIKALQKESFSSERHIMWVYKMQEVLQKENHETINFAR